MKLRAEVRGVTVWILKENGNEVDIVRKGTEQEAQKYADDYNSYDSSAPRAATTVAHASAAK